MGVRIPDEKSIVYYYHHDGDLRRADWRTLPTYAQIGILPVLLVTLRRLYRGWAPG